MILRSITLAQGISGVGDAKAAHALDILGRDHIVMGNPRHREGPHRSRIPVGDRRGPAERHRRQQVEHALGLLNDDAALGNALEAEQAHLAQPGIDVGQDVDGQVISASV